MIGRVARPVTVDRTRPVIQGAYWTLSRRWHCGVWSFLQRVRSARQARSVSASRLSRCVTSVSGRLDQRVRSMLHELAVARPARLVSWTSASGQRDFGCLSF
jgi:hypothetical protein